MMELINNIPSDWEITKLKFFSKIFGRIGFRGYTASDLVDEGEGAITLGPPNIVNQKLNLENKRYLSWEKYEESPEIKVYNGDLLLVKTASVGKVALVENLNEPATINPQLVVFKNININSKFFYYTMVSDVIQFQIAKNLNGGVISTLSQENIRNYVIPLPESSEQHNITDYLDNHIDRINNIISLNENLISLLEEKRTVLINQVVTKGLNPDVPMKDSGIDIVGLIPENNNIIRLKFLCDIKTGDKDTVNRNPDGKYPFYVRSPIIERIDTYSFEGEAVLMAGDGVGAGKVFHYANGKFDYHQRVYNLHNFKKVSPEFIYYYMSSLFSLEIEKGSAKSTVDSVRLPMLENFLICYPPINEQENIVNYLNFKTSKIDNAISKIEDNIKLLEEYKTSLIHHVVTGKIDVRGEEI